MLAHDLLGHSTAAVVARNPDAMIRHIERKAAPHDRQANYTNIILFHFLLLSSVRQTQC